MIITAEDNYKSFDDWIKGKKKILLVCGGSIRYIEGFSKKLSDVEVPIVRFSDFRPNPGYESVVKGVKVFREEGCDSIVAVGGGSAIDVAKCIKLYANLPGDGGDGSWLSSDEVSNDIPFLVMPTTAGTGSEATRFAVIYYKGSKQSVASQSIIPDTVLMDPDALGSLPMYQKKATMCDALCHAIESYWSVNSTDESKEYSKEAIKGVLNHMDGYLANTRDGNTGMLNAAYVAGKAINITQTTAGHAMCYKITSLFGCAHGHATMLCNRILYSWMIENTDGCTDPRGEEYLKYTLDELGKIMGREDALSGAARLVEIFNALQLDVPAASENDFIELKAGVNPVRLKNFPVRLTEETIDDLYHKILSIRETDNESTKTS